jgi:hypothetical protein
MKAELKTQPNEVDVNDFLNKLIDEKKKNDCYKIIDIMKDISGEEPVMWGSSIIGFGHWHYKYESGREGDWFKMGFSPRKQNITIYINPGYGPFESALEKHGKKLGKYKTGKACLYVNKIEDIDLSVLREMIIMSLDYFSKTK